MNTIIRALNKYELVSSEISLKHFLFSLDLKILTTDILDILQHFIPTEAETKAFTSYISDGKSVLNLSDEDRFLYGVRTICC